MINPTFSDTVTVYHQQKSYDEKVGKNVTAWVRAVYTSCFWGNQENKVLNGNELSQASSYTVRIPFCGVALSFATGDIVIKGEISDEIADVQGRRKADLLNRYNPDCFVVNTVSYNTKIPQAAHYRLTGG